MDYARVYDQLIACARGRKRHGYMERHHVLPKCIGGDDSKDNLVFLTAKEHFIAHKLLARMHQNVYGLWQALVAMGRLSGYKSRIFASERERAAELRRNFRYSPESKAKMSASAKTRGRNAPKTEFKPGQQPWNAALPTEKSHRYGKKHAPETIQRMRASQQARREAHSALMKQWWQDRKAAENLKGVPA